MDTQDKSGTVKSEEKKKADGGSQDNSEVGVLRKMKFMFIAISVVVIYKVVLDNLIFEENERDLMLLDMLRNIGNITLILILCLSIRDTVKSMREQEKRI